MDLREVEMSVDKVLIIAIIDYEWPVNGTYYLRDWSKLVIIEKNTHLFDSELLLNRFYCVKYSPAWPWDNVQKDWGFEQEK